jgi:hypothetical protein
MNTWISEKRAAGCCDRRSVLCRESVERTTGGATPATTQRLVGIWIRCAARAPTLVAGVEPMLASALGVEVDDVFATARLGSP